MTLCQAGMIPTLEGTSAWVMLPLRTWWMKCKQLRISMNYYVRLFQSITILLFHSGDLWHTLNTEQLVICGVGISSVCVIVHQVWKAIVDMLGPRHIGTPHRESLQIVVDGFLQRWKALQCAGAIDRSHNPILAPPKTQRTTFIEKDSTQFCSKVWWTISADLLMCILVGWRVCMISPPLTVGSVVIIPHHCYSSFFFFSSTPHCFMITCTSRDHLNVCLQSCIYTLAPVS